jgi:predicted permease
VVPVMGRNFTAEDNQPGAGKVAVISDQLWKREFGGDPNIIGRKLTMNGKPATVVGVMQPGFTFPNTEQIWSPLFNEFPPKLRTDPNAQGNQPNVLALLRRDVSIDQAQLESTSFARHFAKAYPDSNKQFTEGQVQPLLQTLTPNGVRGQLGFMLGFCIALLLIACVNVMNMQFARAALRGKELAVRSSLGATRMRLVRQMLTESLLVAAIGAVLGVALSCWAVDFLNATYHNLENSPIPAFVTFDIDGRVLGFTLGATLLAAVASGLVPALMSSRASATEVLKESGRGNTGRTVHLITRGLVVCQILLACVLLIAALLQLRAIRNQQSIDYGYDTSALMSARMGLMDGDYPTAAARQQFYDRLLRQLRADSEFEAATLTSRFRMVFSGNVPVEIEGRKYQQPGDRPNTNLELVSPGFFGVTGQRLVEGRDFQDDDGDPKLPVAIVNASFAAKHFGRESPLGRRFRLAFNNAQNFTEWRTIIGVVSDVRMLGPFNNPGVDAAGFYVPLYANLFATVGTPEAKQSTAPQFATVVVRPRGGQPAIGLIPALRREVKAVDANLPLYFVNTPKANQEVFTAQGHVQAALFTVFGGIALILASVGLYGVMSFSVSQRRQEFGIRMALGADTRNILTMVLRQGAWQILIGLAAGVGVARLLVAIIGVATIQGNLFNISPLDPATYVSVCALLAVVSFIATLIPARRATRVDPMIALRSE